MTSRTYCPLDCGWHLDDAMPDIPADAVLAQTPVTPQLREHFRQRETALRKHLEDHTLVEWVAKVQALKDELNGRPKDSMLLLAARHLDPTEGVMRPGHVVTDSDLSALGKVLGAVSASLRRF